ncbi:hypothetical protein CRG98_008648 [Punica granatum]|uniref:Uncharacterized protein n=1 Tax=Punica granatum TaxID=22663 RepID=A0A2I0KQY5_PUNGR|nr:hypothetical protein CRG98_008648 [Punica granatum]
MVAAPIPATNHLIKVASDVTGVVVAPIPTSTPKQGHWGSVTSPTTSIRVEVAKLGPPLPSFIRCPSFPSPHLFLSLSLTF